MLLPEAKEPARQDKAHPIPTSGTSEVVKLCYTFCPFVGHGVKVKVSMGEKCCWDYKLRPRIESIGVCGTVSIRVVVAAKQWLTLMVDCGSVLLLHRRRPSEMTLDMISTNGANTVSGSSLDDFLWMSQDWRCSHAACTLTGREDACTRRTKSV